jgi:hypothetical protein
MKLSHISAIAVAFVLAASTSVLNAAESTAQVARIRGAARYSTGNNVWQTLHEGDVLKPGTVIQTASESSVDLVLGSGEAEYSSPQPVVRRFSYNGTQEAQQNVVRLRPNTVLGIDKLFVEQTGADAVSDTQLDLRAGRIFCNVKKLSAASKYEIKLPNGVAGIRGTLTDIGVDSIRVYLGSVVGSIYNAAGELITKPIMGGQSFDCGDGSIHNIPGGDVDRGVGEGGDVGPHGGGNNGGNHEHGHDHTDDHTQTPPSPVVGEDDHHSAPVQPVVNPD